jgi:hypothetical protein
VIAVNLGCLYSQLQQRDVTTNVTTILLPSNA